MSELTEYVIMPGSDYQNICNSVRSKTGGTDVLKSGEVSAAIDSIQASGGGIEHKDVNFYDYDGTLLHSYTVEEASSLTSLPNLPSHDGLICQGWNYDLNTIKEYNRPLNIGAMYITDDGKTRLYINIYSEARKDITIYYGFTGDTTVGVTINWGDGTTETVTDVGNITKTHTYESIGDYIITIANEQIITLGYGSENYTIYDTMVRKIEIGNMVRIPTFAFYRHFALESITIPKTVTSIGSSAFYLCSSLKSITIPNSVISIGSSVFANCSTLESITIPKTVTSIGSSAFDGCSALEDITMPNSVTSIGSSIFKRCMSLKNISMSSNIGTTTLYETFSSCYALKNIEIPSKTNTIEKLTFNYCMSLTTLTIPDGVTTLGMQSIAYCNSLTNLIIPKTVTSIGNSVFNGNTSMKYYDFTSHTSVPSLGINAFSNIPSDCEIRVPAALYDEWVAATNWSTYASNIVAV